MGLAGCLSLFRTSSNDSFGRIRFTSKKGIGEVYKTGKSAAENASQYVSAFRKFIEIAGIPYLIEPDLKILYVEAKDWEICHQCPWKQEDQIPVSVLTAWGEFVTDSSLGITERLFAWSFRVAAGLRWGDLLNTAPATTVLMKEGLIGFDAETKPVGSLKEVLGCYQFFFSQRKMARIWVHTLPK